MDNLINETGRITTAGGCFERSYVSKIIERHFYKVDGLHKFDPIKLDLPPKAVEPKQSKIDRFVYRLCKAIGKAFNSDLAWKEMNSWKLYAKELEEELKKEKEDNDGICKLIASGE